MPGVPSLVTGVGYIGAQLVHDLLDQGDTVVGLENFFSTRSDQLTTLLDHPRFTLVRGSLSDPGAVRRAVALAAPRVAYHLAAQPSAHPDAANAQYTERTNLVGPRVLMEALQEAGVETLVLASSFKVLGDFLPPTVDESLPYGAVGDLAHLSKIYQEKLSEMMAQHGGLRVASVRLGITYGLGPVMKSDPRFQTVPNRFCAQAAAGETLRVQATRPAGFIHVRDAARALRAAAELDSQSHYMILNAAPEVLTVGEVARIVQRAARAVGVEVQIHSSAPMAPGPFRVRSKLESAGFQFRERMSHTVPEVLEYFLRSDRLALVTP